MSTTTKAVTINPILKTLKSQICDFLYHNPGAKQIHIAKSLGLYAQGGSEARFVRDVMFTLATHKHIYAVETPLGNVNNRKWYVAKNYKPQTSSIIYSAIVWTTRFENI